MRITIIPLVIFLLVNIYLSHCGSVYAQAADSLPPIERIGQSQIHPASPLYFLKAVREILEIKFAGTDRIRSLRKMEFSTRRIREVKALVATKREELIAPTLEKYGALLREIIGTINLSDKTLALNLGENIDNHLESLISLYQDSEDPQAKRAIRLAVYRLSQLDLEFIERVSKMEAMVDIANLRKIRALRGCEFLQKEASSSALNEVEKGVYYDRAQDCFQALKQAI
jgi:hypothetical protein